MNKLLVGLDIGTNSVGWCATDENGKIIRKNGKRLWGYLGFDEAKDASERRMYRCQRRRLNRRRQRVELLRGIFENEISKIDNSFFYRLDNSFLRNEDRFDSQGNPKPFKWTLFNDRSFTDKQYYDKFPTIFHLRKYLMESDEKADVRLLYLALHHMIKYRGNFLNNSKEFKVMDKDEILGFLQSMNDSLVNMSEQDDRYSFLEYDDSKFEDLKRCAEESRGISRFKESFNALLNPQKNKFNSDVVIALMAGGEVNIERKICPDAEDSGGDALDGSLCVSKEDFEDKIDLLLSSGNIDEDMVNVLLGCKRVHDYFLIGKLIGKNPSLSAAMVSRYEEHKRQLDELKAWVKKNHSEKYHRIFRLVDADKDKQKVSNYPAYIGSNNGNGTKERFKHAASRDDFYDFLKKELNLKGSEDDFAKEVCSLMDRNEYLLRQCSNENGVFPYQLHKLEMQIILDKQSKFYPFLNDMDDGLSNRDKILSLLAFRIPYYIGPLTPPSVKTEEARKFTWAVRSGNRILPWNFDKEVNKSESARNFIQRMLTKCSYLKSEYCLPKNSLLFSYFNTLNNLNKFMLNGTYLSYDQKMDLIASLFRKKRKVSKKDILGYFKSKYGANDVSLSEKGGVEGFSERYDINFNMASYVDFAGIFGEGFDKDPDKRELVENIIKDIVIFEDKDILEDRLKSEYGIADASVIKKIKALNYSKYGALSAKLLSGLKAEVVDEDTGEVKERSIIQIMELNNQNFMEIINDSKYGFQDIIHDYNYEHGVAFNESIEDYVANLGFVSPIMKRPMIQAYKICEEIEKITGHRIDEYYVECARTNKGEKGKKGMKSTRQDQVRGMLKEARKTANDFISKSLIDNIGKLAEETDTNRFRSDRYYLYFTQLGKCMYTGEDIDIAELDDESKYDIDHIYPQSLIKDDSLSNRVLVKKTANMRKLDEYPIRREILWQGKGGSQAAEKFYDYLFEAKLISAEKHKRLMKRELTETDMESFVNRQLVSTNQAVKCFISAVKELKTIPESDSDAGFTPKVVYSKAENVSDFRKKYDLLKSRTVNNFHHAHDAYLNIMVGRAVDAYFCFYDNKYRRANYYLDMHREGKTTNVMKIFDQFRDPSKRKKDIKTSEGYMVWSFDKSLADIRENICRRFDIFSTERTFVANDLLKKTTVYPKNVGNIGVKSVGLLSCTEKYGGFLECRFGSFCLIRMAKKGYMIKPIPTMYRNCPERYLSDKCGSFEVIVPVLNINTLIEKGNMRFSITGVAGDGRYWVKNRKERFFSYENVLKIRKCEKLFGLIDGKATGFETPEEMRGRGFLFKDDRTIIVSPARNKDNFEITLSVGELDCLFDAFVDMLGKDIYAFNQSLNLKRKLEENKCKFDELSIFGKCVLIMRLLDYLKCNERKAIDLSIIGLEKNGCRIDFNSKSKGYRIVFESITGFYRKVVFEVPEA